MGHVLWLFWVYGGYFLSVATSGFFLYRLCAPFVRPRKGRVWNALLFLNLMGASGMVIWIGDPNLLYTLPVYFALFLLATRGDWVGRLAVCIILFCLEMSVCAFLDSYVQFFNDYGLYDLYDVVTRLARPLTFGALWLLLRRRLPREPATLSRRLWKLVLGLAAMPLCALIAVVLLTFRKYDSAEVDAVAMSQGVVVLPFTLLTSLVLLLAILILAEHERLEQSNRLAGLREVYYQGLRQQETQVRTLRHDLRNHLTVIRGLLEQGKTAETLGYLDQIAGSPALLGNALDNAIEAVCQAEERRITVRCRADKGLLMLRVENTMRGGVRPDLATTKPDKSAHGFGIAGMREIAERYGGSLDAQAGSGRFELLVCLPLPKTL